jgi:hypothetical protein
VESSNDVFVFCPKLSFYASFHSKFLLNHLLGTLVTFVLKLVHTTMLEKHLSNKIDSIMLSIGMPSPTTILVLGMLNQTILFICEILQKNWVFVVGIPYWLVHIIWMPNKIYMFIFSFF